MKTTAPVTSVPIEKWMQEGKSQADRRIIEVMAHLFNDLPDRDGADVPSFKLEDGTECQVRKFTAPRMRDGEAIYGFDVKFNDGPLSHLEFSVRCSGWERDYTKST